MHSIARSTRAVTFLAAAVLGWRFGSAVADASVAIRPQFLVYGASHEQVQMARWAAGRFEIAQLGVPQVEIHFHDDLSDCDGHLGYAVEGRVDLCTSLVDAPTRRALLHELGHVWLDENLAPWVQAAFLRLRDLSAWNSSSDPWNLRGYEHGAEVMAWALGERILTPSIPDNEPEKLGIAFRFLTGGELPMRPILDAKPPARRAIQGSSSDLQVPPPILAEMPPVPGSNGSTRLAPPMRREYRPYGARGRNK
jgi:hypothetical protein